MQSAALCGAACCTAGAPRRTSDYIDRGFRRRARPALPTVGPRIHDETGRFAQFTLRVDDGIVKDVAFDATVCATLLAYCELAAEWSSGVTLREAARRVGPRQLAEALPLVPARHRDRAVLAAQAFISSLVQSARECGL